MNIVLIGMPGCGKSTIGVLLAKSLLMDFVDTDLVIQKEYSASLCEIISNYGLEQFKDIENSCLSKIKCDNTVIATGGSAVYGKEAMQNLSQNATVIYLNIHPLKLKKRIKNIKTRGIAMKEGADLIDLYIERAPLYKKYANITIDCNNKTAEKCINEIVKKLSQN